MMAAHSVYHWLIQRATAFILLPLSIWVLFKFLGVITLIIKSVSESNLYTLNIYNTDLIILLCFFIFAFYHAILGVKVILEDYIHSDILRASVFITIKSIVALTILFLIFVVLYNNYKV